MTYIRVTWKHEWPDMPVLVYSELDDQRWEARKVAVYRDGHCEYADAEVETGSTGLSETRIPTLDEIVADPQFDAKEIPAGEFEAAWNRRDEEWTLD